MLSNQKNIVALLLMTIFLSLRIGNAHTFIHLAEDTEQTQCELCDFITQTQEITPVLDSDPASQLQLSTPLFVEKSESTINYEEPLSFIVSPAFLYNKPPPSE